MLVAAVVVLLVVVAATVVLVVQRVGRADPRPAGLLPAMFDSPPSAAWTLDLEPVSGADEARLATPFYDAHQGGQTGYLEYDDLVVTRVVRLQTGKGGETPAQLIAVDTADGRVRWSAPVTYGGGCSYHALGDVLPCLIAVPGDRMIVRFIDLSDGSIRHESALPFSPFAVAAHAGSMYLTGSDDRSRTVITRGTMDEPVAGWQKELPNSECTSISGPSRVDVFGEFVAVTSTQVSALLRADDGSPFSAEEEEGYARLVGDRGAVLDLCDTNRPADRELFLPHEHPQFMIEGNALSSALTVTAQQSVPVLVGRGTEGFEVVDTESGTTSWSDLSFDEDTAPVRQAAVVGDVMLVEHVQGVRAYDMRTGGSLWQSDDTGFGNAVVTDGERIVVARDSTITATSLIDGSPAWSIDTGSDDVSLGGDRVGAVDEGLLYMSDRILQLYPGTGDPTSVPNTIPRSSQDDNTSADPVTRCGRAPQMTPVGLRTDRDALVVTMKFTAACPGGDVLASESTRIAISSTGSNVAAAVFDFAAAPLAVPRPENSTGYTIRDLRFPTGTFWRLPSDLPAPLSTSGVSAGSSYLVECEQSGRVSTEFQDIDGGDAAPIDATGPARPITGDSESASFDALRAIADADMATVESDLADRWVPQLSSKQPGLVADGTTWNNAGTLEEHLSLRLRYPNVRLVRTGDWSTFRAPDYWVTVAGVPTADSAAAVRWCDTENLDAEHCYAKLISRSHSIEGSTVFR